MNDNPSPDIKIDAANVVEGTGNVIHDAERTTRHALSHLEDDFVAKAHLLFEDAKAGAVYSVAKAKELLAWLAGRL